MQTMRWQLVCRAYKDCTSNPIPVPFIVHVVITCKQQNRKGVALVVSHLIALMKDQTDSLLAVNVKDKKTEKNVSERNTQNLAVFRPRIPGSTPPQWLHIYSGTAL